MAEEKTGARTASGSGTGRTSAKGRAEKSNATGSRSVGDTGGGGRKKGLAWLLLPLLALLGLGAFLLARNAGDAGDERGVDVTDERAAPGQDPPGPDANRNDGSDAGSDPDTSTTAAGGGGSATTATTAAAAGGGTATTAAAAGGGTATTAPAGAGAGLGAGAAAANSPLVSQGTPLLPLPSGGLAAYTNKPASANGVIVESVVSDEGFWVGDSPTNRVFVRFIQRGESPIQVTAGRRVNFEGQVKPNTPAIAEGVEASEGLAQLQQQGHHIETTPGTLRLS